MTNEKLAAYRALPTYCLDQIEATMRQIRTALATGDLAGVVDLADGPSNARALKTLQHAVGPHPQGVRALLEAMLAIDQS